MGPNETIQIVIADDHPLVRSSLRRLLEMTADIQVVAEVGDAAALVGAVASLRPKILLLDMKMPGPGPVKTIEWVHASSPETAVVALTAFDDDGYLWMMATNGAAGFLLKTDPIETIITSLRRVAQGKTIFTLDQIARARNWQEEVGRCWASLTDREQEVALLLAQGAETNAIAAALHVERRTVDYHVFNLLAKLGVSSRVTAIVWIRDNFPEEWWRGLQTG